MLILNKQNIAANSGCAKQWSELGKLRKQNDLIQANALRAMGEILVLTKQLYCRKTHIVS